MTGRTLIRWVGATAIGSFLLNSPCVSQSVGQRFSKSRTLSESSERRQFIAAFDWSVERSESYTWPFEATKPAPDKTVWIVFERMPRVWSERGRSKTSIGLAAPRVLRINGQPLPKPQRVNGSEEAYRVSLVNGRLRFYFSLPWGVKLAPGHTTVRVKLFQVD